MINNRLALFEVAALHILDSGGTVEPEALSRMVYEYQNVNIIAQWLSKNLKPLGIKAKKREGRRVFMPSREELQKAQSVLGIATPITEIGQQEHGGQQNLMKEVDLAL